jgi:hypothetical protein
MKADLLAVEADTEVSGSGLVSQRTSRIQDRIAFDSLEKDRDYNVLDVIIIQTWHGGRMC